MHTPATDKRKTTDDKLPLKNQRIEAIFMTSTDDQVKEISPFKSHSDYVSEQPIDRHLVEITDEIKSVFINAGIDSTW
jgi:hypothetical protein